MKHLEVVQVLVLELGLPVDFGERHFARINHIQKLTIESTSTKLLDFGDIAFEEGINPNKELPTRKFNGVVGIAGNFVNHNRLYMK